MGKKKEETSNCNQNSPKLKVEPITTSFLDSMVDGKEYLSIAGLKNVNVDLGSEIHRSIEEITKIRKRPLICYISNVLNRNIRQSVSIDNSDDIPFLEMLKSVPQDEKELDIILVTPGGSAETVDFLVKQIRSRFENVSFILPYMAMSAGTIFCLSGDELIMDENAFFGPIDPQVISKNGRFVPAQSLSTLLADIQARGQEQLSQGKQPNWTDIQILNNLDAKEIGNAINASKLSTNLVSNYLENYKFKYWCNHHDGTPVTDCERKKQAEMIASQLCEHSLWLSHSSRISRDMAWETCKLKITHPEEIDGLARAIKRFWALISFSLENTMTTKMFVSSNYMLFRNEVTKNK